MAKFNVGAENFTGDPPGIVTASSTDSNALVRDAVSAYSSALAASHSVGAAAPG